MFRSRQESRYEQAPQILPPNFKRNPRVNRGLYDTLPPFSDVAEGLAAINLLKSEIASITSQLENYQNPAGGVKFAQHTKEWADGAAAAMAVKQKQIPLIQRWLDDEGIKDAITLSGEFAKVKARQEKLEEENRALEKKFNELKYTSTNAINHVKTLDAKIEKLKRHIFLLGDICHKRFAYCMRFLWGVYRQDTLEINKLAALISWLPTAISENPSIGLNPFPKKK